MVAVIYSSAEKKSEEQASVYVGTHQAPHRYLAYKDIPFFIHQFVDGNKALDYGAGTGASTAFLHTLGLKVIGIDISQDMLSKAQASFPQIQFADVASLTTTSKFDLVFSSFVLFELSSKNEITQYLTKSFSLLKKNGIFIGITGSEHLYSVYRQWMTFEANFKENRELQSGNLAKLVLKYPLMEFYDYYWTEKDYVDCFTKAGFEILQIHNPLGSLEDPYHWKDELRYSPFTIFVAKKLEKNKHRKLKTDI